MRKLVIVGLIAISSAMAIVVGPYIIGDETTWDRQEAEALGATGIYTGMAPPQQQVSCRETRSGERVTVCLCPDGWEAIRNRNIVEVRHHPDGGAIVMVDFRKKEERQ